MTDPRLELGDPTTSAQRLFELAQSNPELGPQIAAHPNAYPGLRDWIAQYAAPAAASEPPQVQQAQQAPEQQVQHQAPAQEWPAAQPAPQQQPAQPWQAATAAPQHQAPAQFEPQQFTQPTTPLGHTQPTEQLPQAQAAAPFGAGQPQPGAWPGGAGHPGGPGYPGPGGPAPAAGGKRSKKPLFITLAAVLVVALIAVGGIIWATIASKVGGSRSPEAAAAKIIDGFTSFDPLTLYGSLAPSEISGFTAATERLMEVDVSSKDEESLRQAADRLKNAVSIEVDGIETETEELAEGVERVVYIGGTITIDGDEDEIVDAMMDFYALSGELTGSSSRDYLDYMEDDLRDSIDLPYVFDFAEYEDDHDIPIGVVTVQEGGSWYVSPMLSMADAVYRPMAEYGDAGRLGSEVVEGEPAESPEAAGAALAEAVVNGDLDDIAAHLPLAERRLLSIYGEPLFDDIDGWNDGIELDAAEFSAETSGSTARLGIEDLSISIPDFGYYGDEELSLKFSGHCVDIEHYDPYWDETERNSGCLDDVIPKKIYTELGLDEAALIAVKEGGGWFVSPVATVADIVAIVSARTAELSQEGKLEDLFDDISAY